MNRIAAILAATSLLAFSAPLSAKHHENDRNAAIDIAATQDALTMAENRSVEDKARDGSRKPAEVLHWLGVKKGDTVLDIIASGGWYSVAAAIAVGPEGKVYAQNPAAALALRDGAYETEITARLEAAKLPQVTRLNKEAADLGIPDNSVDVAITALNFHDVYYNFGEEAATGMLAVLKAKLKPGGVLGIIDHVGLPDADNPDADNKALHRMDPVLAVAAAEAAGFKVERNDDLLDSYDDPSRIVFDPLVRGKTDRFILKLTKPE